MGKKTRRDRDEDSERNLFFTHADEYRTNAHFFQF